jgi:alkylation response protein AidB-like acyl-CoA dehydrogenase
MAATTSPPEIPADRGPVDPGKQRATTFAAEALRRGGKAEEEVRRTGAVDAADDRVEAMFAARYQTVNSPIHRAIWEHSVPIELFGFARPPIAPSSAALQVIQQSLRVGTRRRFQKTLFDADGKISSDTLDELGRCGYWGLLIEPRFGGTGASFTQFAKFLTEIATIEPTLAGLASVHGCIGAVDPLVAFGNPEQQERLLPKLSSGAMLSAFALTEPGAGSDLTALRTTARLDGDDYLITGEKLFITNVLPGRMIGIVCQIDGKPAVLIAELPRQENESFRLVRYGLHALRRAHNFGILFRDFRVPAQNRLDPRDGDGLTIAYHGLNRGRVALCATAAGVMRGLLCDMLPWAHYRRTYGAAIETRELVRRRIGHLAGLIVACDALTEWCAGLLDEGYRGELECIVAKIFASEAQKEAAVELHMKTHGGRSFLSGHLFGDNVHDFLAPCIYEGEGEMLGMAFFKSLVKNHARHYFEPIGKALESAGIHQPQMTNPAHAWALREPLWNYMKWWVPRRFERHPRLDLPEMSRDLRRHVEFASRFLSRSADELSGVMRKHQLKLADRQCRMAELSQRVQTAVVILCTSLYAARSSSAMVMEAAACLCETLSNRLTGRRTSDAGFKRITHLGAEIAANGFPGTDHIEKPGILMRYEQ